MSGSERTFQLVVEAIRQLEREHVRRLDAVPALVDITVSLALMDGGVEAAEEVLERVRRRIENYRGGEAAALVEPNPRDGGGGLSAFVSAS
jgi:hypothetical protein